MQDKCTHDVSGEINAVLHSVEDDVYLTTEVLHSVEDDVYPTTEVFSDISDCAEWTRVSRGHISISFAILKKEEVVSAVQVHFSLHYRLKKITGSNAVRAVVQPA